MSQASGQFKRILVPVDLSPRSGNALKWAVAFGSLFRAEIDVLHVWHSDLATKVTVARDSAKSELREFVAALSLRGEVGLNRRTDHGDPYLTIQRTLQLAGYDLVVVAGPEAGRGERPSVSLGLLSTAPCAVVSVPAHRRARLRSATDSALSFERLLVPLALAGLELSALTCAEALARPERATVEVLTSSDVAPELLAAFRSRSPVERGETHESSRESSEAIALRLREAALDLLVFCGERSPLGQRPADARRERLVLGLSCPSLSLPRSGAIHGRGLLGQRAEAE